jgi:hypothetical protein
MIYETLPEFATAARTFMDGTAQRYRQLADAMTSLLKHETAATFRQLDSMQQEARQNIFGPTDTGDTNSTRLNGVWVDEDDELLPEDIVDSIYSLTPVTAINLALHNNRRVLRLLTNELAWTHDHGIRALAGQLHRVIFDQMVRLRLERMKSRRRRKVSALDEELARLLKSKEDIKQYRHDRDICLRSLRDQLMIIARSSVGEDRDIMLTLADTIFSPASLGPGNAVRQTVEGNTAVQAIAAVERVFDTLLLTAQKSEVEALFRLAQDDARKLLPTMRKLHKLVE